MGRELIYILPGYWRSHNMTDKIESCYNLEKNCVGDSQKILRAGNKASDYCYEGHIGALCE